MHMRQIIDTLIQTKIFAGIDRGDIPGLLKCINAREKDYGDGEMIIQEGSIVRDFAIVLSGSGRAIRDDAEGRPVIITLLEPKSEIGIMIAASSAQVSPVSVQSLSGMAVLTIPYDRVLARCHKACASHDRLLANYMSAVAEKGLMLHERLGCLLKPTLRQKIVSYLSLLSREQGSSYLVSPLDRAAMAEYLNTDRSALSRELSRMKQEGLIDFYRSSFRLLKP